MTSIASAPTGVPALSAAPFSVPPFSGPRAVGLPIGSSVRPWQTGPYVPAPWRAASATMGRLTPVVSAAALPTPVLTPVLTVAAVPSLAPTPVMPMAAIRTPDVLTPAMAEDGLSRDSREPAEALTPIAALLFDPSSIEATFAGDADGTVPVDAMATEELPWIDHFLATTPVAPMEAIAGPPDVYRFATPAASSAILRSSGEVDVVGEEIAAVPVQGIAGGATDATLDAVAADSAVDDAEHILQAFAHVDGPESEPASAPVLADLSTDLASEFADDFAAVFGEDREDGAMNGSVSDMVPTGTAEPYRTPFAAAALVPPYIPPVGSSVQSATPSDAAPAESWPLAEAADALDEIARELGDGDGVGDATPARLFGTVGAPSPLPAWSDEDMMDIMPMRHATPAATGAEETSVLTIEPFDSSALAADASAQAAAQALETLAQRVRAGELQLPGYDPRMGDAAALVSALAALLGLRLG